MSDLVIFVAIVGLVVVVGIAVGMIVAGRIDRILAPRPAAADDAAHDETGNATDTEEERP